MRIILIGAIIFIVVSIAVIVAILKIPNIAKDTQKQNELLIQQLRIMKRQLEKEGLNKAEISSIITKD